MRSHRSSARVRRGPAILSSLLVCTLFGLPVHSQEAVLLADQADGIIDVVGVSRIEVTGIEGTLTLRAGQQGKLRFACRSLDNRREERPVSLWESGSTMRLSFSEQLAPQRLLLEVTVPAGMTAVIVAHKSKVVLNGVQGDVSVSGSELAFDGRTLGGDVNLEIAGGSVTVIGSGGEVALKGQNLQTKLTQIAGDVDVKQVGGRLDLLEVQGGLLLDLEKVEVTADLITKPVDVRATGGTLSLSQLRAGGVFEVSEAPLKIVGSVGGVEIDTDAQTEFENHTGSLTVHSFGGGLSGTNATGAVLFSGSGGEVRLGQLGGAVGVSGDRLTVQLEGIKGDVTINTTSSEIHVANAEGQVDLTNDFGDVTLVKVGKPVKIVNRDGAVSITDLEGSADVTADGPVVSVHWSEVSTQGDSSVQNAGGDVRLLFSPKGGGQIEAEADDGRIESSLQGVTVSDDGTKASGPINRLSSPTIRVVSSGNVYLAGAPLSKAQN